MSAADYFAAVRKARDSIVIPGDLAHPTETRLIPPAELVTRFAATNASYPLTAFRVTCYHDGELQELRVCLTRDLAPRPCSANVGSCAAGAVKLLPPD
jgi:ribonuclease T2